ncbi:MAG: S1 RNA-binding domain-containing protein [Ruminococcus sp.]|nr:S1 RNA-binding domain-containing protein [Ruminococcus sp.]
MLVWENCLKEIPPDIPVVISDTICNATDVRQSDACKLAMKSDIMIVVGGKHSSNTVKLYDVCSKYCKTYHIENSAELESLDIPVAENIGITAGASTPAYIIKEVLTKMAEIEKETIQEEENFQELLDKSFKKIRTGDKVKATVVAVNNTEVVVDLGTKHTGYVTLEDLTDDLTKKPSDIVSIGDEIDLIVGQVKDGEGVAFLSKKKVDEQAGYEKIVKAKEEGTVLEGVVQHIVNRGVTLNIYGVRVFIPASQAGLAKGEELESLKGKKVKFMIIEVTEGRKRAVGSVRAVQNAEKEEAKAKFWENTSIGDTFTGTVKSITNFGAFVDLGGIDGMVHISELSWRRLRHPSEVISVGDTLEVYIKDLDKESGRISLGHRKSEENPWEIFMNNYKVGDVVNVTVVSITAYGAFAQIIDGVDGLIHISRIANRKVENVKDVLSVGDEVTVKITNIEEDRKRVSISIRDVEDTEEAE